MTKEGPIATAHFGRTAATISRIGFGGWQAGGQGPWGAGPTADDDAVIDAIRHAVESGVNWVDTAASYGLGRSEEIVAKALAPWRVGEDVLVFTKCGHPWTGCEPTTDLHPTSIRAECEASLRRLGIERIDLLQLHHPDPAVPVEESWATLGELVDEGKVRWIGVSNFTTELLSRCEAVRHVDSVQPQLNLLQARAREDVIPWASSRGTGVLVYSPLAGGLLSGKYGQSEVDLRRSAERLGLASAQAWSAIGQLRSLAARLNCSIAATAVAWVLSVEGVTGAICGARRPYHVDGWVSAAELLSHEHIRDRLNRIEPVRDG